MPKAHTKQAKGFCLIEYQGILMILCVLNKITSTGQTLNFSPLKTPYIARVHT